MTQASGPQEQGAGAVSAPEYWPHFIPDPVWAPIATTLVLLCVGVTGVIARQPWLFPSLGPTAFTQTEYPGHRTARFYNVLMGHGCGVAAGLLAVFVSGASGPPSILATARLTTARMAAAAIAVALTILLTLLLRAAHPPAVSTSLLFALGVFRPNLHDVLVIGAGVLITACAGELLRRLRLRRLRRYLLHRWLAAQGRRARAPRLPRRDHAP
jgi:hypothetical protein